MVGNGFIGISRCDWCVFMAGVRSHRQARPPLLQRLGAIAEREKGVSPTLLIITLALVMLGAWFTDRIGIYAVFGAFIMGAAMPRGRFAHAVRRQLEPLTTTFLLPLFFVYSGLNTRIALVDSLWLWGVALVVLLAACLGKGVACWVAAPWQWAR